MKLAWLVRLFAALLVLAATPAGAAGAAGPPPVPPKIWNPPPVPSAPPAGFAPGPAIAAAGRPTRSMASSTDLFRAGRPWLFSLFPRWWEEGSALTGIARSDLVVLPVEAAAGDPSQLDRMVDENGDLRAFVYLEVLGVPASAITSTYGAPIDAAWWLSRPATKLASAIGTTDTTISVLDGTRVSAGDDLLIDGENVQVLSKAGNLLTVKRGYFSTPRPHPSGAAVKPHVVSYRDANGVAAWALNISPDSPRAANGQSVIDFIVDSAGRKLSTSFFWSGIYLSPAFQNIDWLDDGRADSDGDGVADGSPKWDAGVKELIAKLRARLGDVPILGLGDDSARLDINGSVFDTFGSRGYSGSVEYGRWQQQLSSYLAWSDLDRAPKVLAVSTSVSGTVQYQDARFTIGTALLGDGALHYEAGTEATGMTDWFDEFDDGGAGMGYLGEPLGPAARVLTDLGANTLANGAFENGLNGWGIWADAGYSITQSFSTSDKPAGVGRSIVLTPTAGTPWRASIAAPRLAVTKDRGYVITFWAKAATPRVIQLGVQQDAEPWTNRGEFQQLNLDTSWKEYTYSFTSSGDDPIARLMFWLGDSAAQVMLAGVTFKEGNGDFWRRDFSGGMVLVNGGVSAKTVGVGNSLRYIRGSQDPAVNTGKQAKTVTVPPSDARILVKTDEFRDEHAPDLRAIFVPNARR